VIVGGDKVIRSTGFNGFPRGVDDRSEILENRNLKYRLICHAEENAIIQAARIGVSVDSCNAYVTWPPCSRCARSFLQAGICEIVFPDGCSVPERWWEDFAIAQEILGSRVRRLDNLQRVR
tara:strand:- start:196 stop:558 length:363 start_codon:yes stop_codon:yes gene_type:complete